MIKTSLTTLGMIPWEWSLAPWSYNQKTAIIPESQETPECPFNQPQTSKRPLKPVVDELSKSSLSCKNTFLKEFFFFFLILQQIRWKKIRRTWQSFSKYIHYHSPVADSQLVVKLLKNRVSTLEEQLIDKNAIIDFLLKEKK